MSTGLALAIAVVLLIANAFFVAVEFGLIATQRSQLEDRAASGNRRARRALALITDLNIQIAGAQLGITMATIGLGIVAEPSVAHLLEDTVLSGLPSEVAHTVAVIIALTLVTFLHILLAEMVPKNIALADAPGTAMWLGGIHGLFVRIARPLVWLLNAMSNGVLRLIGIEARDEREQAKTPEELFMLLAEAREEDVLDDYEHQLLSGTLELGEQSVRSALVPWEQVAAVNATAPIREVEATMAAAGHSRLALTNDEGRPIGWVHAKDLLAVDAEGWDDPLPQHRRRRLLELDPDTEVEVALERMRKERSHFAVARDGDTNDHLGIITLEDVLAILVAGLAGNGSE